MRYECARAMCVRERKKESERVRAHERLRRWSAALQIQSFDWCMVLSVSHACLLIKIDLICLYSCS